VQSNKRIKPPPVLFKNRGGFAQMNEKIDIIEEKEKLVE